MPAQGKHRRPRSNALTRGIVAAGAGGAALALPLTVATTANAATPAQAVTSVQSAPQSAPAAAQPASRTYTVVSGDTLSSIARKHHTKGGWQRLYKDNRTTIGDNPALIRPGLKLKLNATKSSTAQKSSTASTATQASVKTYANNLDGWIRESLDIMAQKGIPGTYNGIYRNIIRESSGNPQAINNWDSNAAAGTRRRASSRSSTRRSPRTTCPAPRTTPTTRSRTSRRRATTPPTGTARSTTSSARTEPPAPPSPRCSVPLGRRAQGNSHAWEEPFTEGRFAPEPLQEEQS